MKSIDTNQLIEELRSKGLHEYLAKYDGKIDFIEVRKYLNYLIESSPYSKIYIIKESGLNKYYAYQIMNGTKKPTRNKLLPFVFVLGLDLETTPKMFKCCNYPLLSPKNRRDAIIIYAIINKLKLNKVNDLLFEYNLGILG